VPNFSHLLRKPVSDAKKPPVLPEGTYYGQITKHDLGESAQKKTPFLQWSGTYTHAEDSVDLRDEAGEPIVLEGKRFQFSHYLTEDSLYRLREFLESCGLETEGRSFEELIPQAIGKSVMLEIIQAPIEDKQTGETRMIHRVNNIVGQG